MQLLLLLLCISGLCLCTKPVHGGCYKKPSAEERKPIIRSPQPHLYVDPDLVPVDFSWCNYSGVNYCSSSRNQHIPQYCGSCWAMAASSSFADRIRIARKGKFPDYMIAVQTLVYCSSSGCGGGSSEAAFSYIEKNGIGPDTCQNYVAVGHGNECTSVHQCENCMSGKGCWAVTNYTKFGVQEKGDVKGVFQMKAELMQRGPLACYVDAGPIWDYGFGPDRAKVFDKCAGCDSIDHVISVVGWGWDAEQAENYWIIRNNWGEYWGVDGFLRVKMGDDQLGMESTPCAWAVPFIPAHLL